MVGLLLMMGWVEEEWGLFALQKENNNAKYVFDQLLTCETIQNNE